MHECHTMYFMHDCSSTLLTALEREGDNCLRENVRCVVKKLQENQGDIT